MRDENQLSHLHPGSSLKWVRALKRDRLAITWQILYQDQFIKVASQIKKKTKVSVN